MQRKRISPSLICMDLCNLQSEIEKLEKIGCDMLHVDIIDGIFSPDMPLAINTVRELKKISNMIFDTHLMSVNNTPYVEMLLECGVDRLCFHPEYEERPSILLRKIRAKGVKAGLAVSPETTIEAIRYLLPLCDFVLLMRIDAGYAHLAGQVVYPQIKEKIELLYKYMEEYGIQLEIEVDGRVGFDETKELLEFGVDTFVSGTKGVFKKDDTLQNNWNKLQQIIKGE